MDEINEINNNQNVSSGDDDDDMMAVLHGTLAAVYSHVVDSDSESSKDEGTWGGSKKGKACNVDRDFAGVAETLIKQYFSGQQSVYNEESFERRFGGPRPVIMRVFNTVKGIDPFILKTNRATRLPGIRPIVRLVAAMRMLVYGDCADQLDEHLQISESVANENLRAFCKAVVDMFKDEYLNQCPTAADKARVLALNKKRGFPGLFASWDCKHYFWKNCPMDLAGQYKGKEKRKTVVMEAICDPEMYV